jgi:prepilin-type N-terminal cleavage/methylation domain-containing protein
MKKSAFTLIELIFVIVIIGVLAAVAVPKFEGLSSNAKISSEMATAATVQSALDDIHATWITSEGEFSWGNNKSVNCSDGDNSNDGEFDCDAGYPLHIGDCDADNPFLYLLKNPDILKSKWSCSANNDYHGPASKTDSGVGENGENKPDSNDHWEYNTTNGTFTLVEG